MSNSGEKEAELQRVIARAQQEAATAALLRKRKEGLQQLIRCEVDARNILIRDTKHNTDRKEREITRLSFLAEQDKKTGMFLCQQIAQLKKSLEGFLQAREDSKPETLCRILARCSSSADLYGTATGAHAEVPSSPVPAVMRMRTSLGRELDGALREDAKKTLELARVSRIVDVESKRVDSLKAKVEELKQGLVSELQEADEQLEMKMKEFVQKQLAIEKVTARAERERVRSLFLKGEIVKLTDALGDSEAKRKGKTPEYGPDKAYLSEFSELCDLETVEPVVAEPGGEGSTADPNTTQNSDDMTRRAASLPVAIVNNLRARDPTAYIISPPCKTIPISPVSGSIYAQKLKDIATLHKETTKKDTELVRLKKLAEAERCRHLLLKDRFELLQRELHDRECAHTL